MKQHNPPKWAIRFLHWFCRPEIADEIEGDLREEFRQRLSNRSPFVAKFRFVVSVISFIQPFAIRRKPHAPASSYMFQSYLKVAWRGMLAHKMFTAINIISLSVSLSVGLILVALVSDILRFDTFHEKKQEIRRVISTVYEPGRRTDEKATAPLRLADNLMNNAAVDKVVRINRSLFDEVVTDQYDIPVEGYFTDPSFFEVFSFPMISGTNKLKDPNTLIITRATAMKLFNSIDVIGRTIKLKSLGDFTISGVMEDIPRQSHLQFDLLSPITTEAAASLKWEEFYRTYVYFTLNHGYDDEDLQAYLNSITDEVYPNADKFRASFSIQSLLSIVPGKNLSMQIGPKMLPWPLIIISLVAIVIMLSACFNYTNLAIARALRRTKEVALRKISGAKRTEIVGQFIFESVLISLFALTAGIWLFMLIRPYFLENIPAMNRLTGMELSPMLVVRFILLAIAVGVFAGILPALLISKVKILESLKQLKTIRLVGSIGIRNTLVIFQLTLSLFLITGIGIVYKQYQFAINRDLGFDKENILTIDLNGVNYENLHNKLEQVGDVVSISYSSMTNGTSETESSLVVLNDGFDSLYVNSMSTDAQYLDDYNLKFIAGRNFPDSVAGVRERFAIVNRKFLPHLKSEDPSDALGKVIHIDSSDLLVIGVVEDFPYTQIDEPMRPVLIRNVPAKFEVAFVKLQSKDMSTTMQHVERAWSAVSSGKSFQSRFFEDRIEETYVFYVRLMRIFGYVGSLAFAIAILGLLGITMYAAETRRKEIGIRKILGAGDGQIVMLISRGFVVLLCVAATIALPGVYLLFNNVILAWSAYHVTIGFVEMFIGPIILLTIGGTVIASQTLRAARTNPAETLRAE